MFLRNVATVILMMSSVLTNGQYLTRFTALVTARARNFGGVSTTIKLTTGDEATDKILKKGGFSRNDWRHNVC